MHDERRALARTEWLRAGVSDEVMRHPRFGRPSCGVRTSDAASAADIDRAVLASMSPHAFLMGASAARTWLAPLPRWLELREADRREVGMPRGRRASRRPDVRGRSVSVLAHELHRMGGVSLTSPARTWFDLAAVLDLPDLVAVADHMLRRWDERCTTEGLDDVIRAHGRSPGIRRAREALPLVSVRAESPPESRLRVLLALGGLPAPLVNAIVRDPSGAFVGRVDLLFAEYGVIVEYEGAQHGDDAGQWRTDITRINDLQALGYIVIRVHKDDLRDPAALVRRIRRVLVQRGLR
jgi:hypothetical protein